MDNPQPRRSEYNCGYAAYEQPPATDDKQADEIRRRTGCKGGAMAEGAHLEASPRGEHEWTPEYVKQLIHEQPAFMDIYTRLSDAHKSALAAEREKHAAEIRQLTTDNWRYCEEQRQQLAAEREKTRILGNMTDGFRSQLQDRHKLCVDFETKWKECRDQLAAEREKRK